MGRFILLCILMVLQMEGNDGKIRRCAPGQTSRVFHLCKGDVVQCNGPDALGSWNVTKIDFCNGVLHQPDRQVDLGDRHLWELPCQLQGCKFDFFCQQNPLEDNSARGHLDDGLCYREALVVYPWLLKKGHKQKGRRERALEEKESNMFIQVHNELFGKGQIVCYPPMTSVSGLFTVSPEWGRTEGLVKCQGEKPVPFGDVTMFYDETLAPPANCLPLPRDNGHSYPGCEHKTDAVNLLPCNFTINTDNRQYGSCFTNQGDGCIVIDIPSNISCLVQIPHQPSCNSTSEGIECSIPEECIPIYTGPQLVCGWANGTHLTIGPHHFPIPRDGHLISESWMSWANGGSVINSYRHCNRSLYTEKGYYFFFNGTVTNVLRPPFPRNVAVGALVPITVPCPASWSQKEQRILRRAVHTKFCANWRNPETRGDNKGHAIGWGVLSALTLGGTAGSEATKNGNYIICGLTILGNSTTGALEAITNQLSKMHLFSLEDRYALDYQLVRDRGMCAIVNNRCMMGIQDRTSNITKHQNDSGMKEGIGWRWIIIVAIFAAIVFVCFLGIAIKCINARPVTALGNVETGENISLQPQAPMLESDESREHVDQQVEKEKLEVCNGLHNTPRPPHY